MMRIPVKQRWKDRPLYTCPSCKMAFGRSTEEELSLEIIPRLRKFYETLEAWYREQQKDIWWFDKTGAPAAMIQLFAGEDKPALKKIDVTEWNVICLDELQNFPGSVRRSLARLGLLPTSAARMFVVPSRLRVACARCSALWP